MLTRGVFESAPVITANQDEYDDESQDENNTAHHDKYGQHYNKQNIISLLFILVHPLELSLIGICNKFKPCMPLCILYIVCNLCLEHR